MRRWAGSEAQAKGTVVKSAGWRAVRGEKEEDDGGGMGTPKSGTGRDAPDNGTRSGRAADQTQAAAHRKLAALGDGALRREIDDEQLRASIRETGIGTPATRAAVIETLFARGYIQREKKSLVPTDKGMAVYETVKDKKIANVEMTAAWEDTLARIESGRGPMLPAFRRDIEAYTAQIVTELLETKVSVAPSESEYPCPKCRNSRGAVLPQGCQMRRCGLWLYPLP